jgi:hypothetical protein
MSVMLTLLLLGHIAVVMAQSPLLFIDTDPSGLVDNGIDSDDDLAFAYARFHAFTMYPYLRIVVWGRFGVGLAQV